MTVTRKLTEHKIPDKPLGRHVEHDPRSRAHAFSMALAPAKLKTVHHRRYGPAFDQSRYFDPVTKTWISLGSCTGNAMAGALNTLPLHKPAAKQLTEQEAVALYSAATKLDSFDGEYPPQDTGSSGLAVAKAAQQRGFIMSYSHAFSITEALAALQLGPVITGVGWLEGFDTPDHNGLVKPTGQERGGHEFEVLGFEWVNNLNDSLVIGINSWSPKWGRFGRFSFTVQTWAALLAAQGDVTILNR